MATIFQEHRRGTLVHLVAESISLPLVLLEG